MPRRLALAGALLALAFACGCAGPNQLAQKSQEKLAGGERWRAWALATKALDKDPGNDRARAAAAAAGNSIALDWQRRIRALADLDSVKAAEQVLEFAAFRAGAVRYTVVAVSAEWAGEEQALRRTAARLHYRQGVADLESRRPKKAWLHLTEAETYVAGYRDAARLANQAWERAVTRVAIVPFRSSSGYAGLGREVATVWRDDLARRMAPPQAQFTRILGDESVEAQMTVSQLGAVSRDEALRIARRAGADRVVFGSIGGVDSDQRLHVFTDVIARRVVEKTADGHSVTRWVDVPIEVIARERIVTVDVEYEVIQARAGTTLARRRDEHTSAARVVWTSYLPQGDLDAYVLVSETTRSADPERAKQIETRWKSTCGESTTLRQVLEARRATKTSARYRRDVLPRFIAGAAFVFLEDLPPVGDLAYAALAGGWEPLADDLLRIDATDDVDLGVALAAPNSR